MGSFGAILALVQSSTTANPHVLASALTPTQSSRPSRFSSSKIRVEIETETKHEVDSRSMPNVVALELADWKARAEDGKAQPGWA